MRILLGAGWFAIGVAVMVWGALAFLTYEDRRAGFGRVVPRPDTSGIALYAVAVDTGGRCRVVYWPQVIERR